MKQPSESETRALLEQTLAKRKPTAAPRTAAIVKRLARFSGARLLSRPPRTSGSVEWEG